MKSRNEELIELVDNQTKQIEDMKEELEEYKNRLEDHSRDTDLLKRLYDNGYIDLNGDPIERNS